MKVPIFDEVVVNKRHRARLAHIPHLPPGEKYAVPYAYGLQTEGTDLVEPETVEIKKTVFSDSAELLSSFLRDLKVLIPDVSSTECERLLTGELKIPTGYPDVCLVMAENEKAVADTPLWKVGLALIGVVEARG